MNIILFGPPGAGKGTQSDKLIDRYRLKHLSTGDLFRMHLGNKTHLGTEAKKFMDEGNLVPDSVVINMVKEEIENNNNNKGFIFDGFPRTVNQALALDEMLNEKTLNIDKLISLEVDDKELIRRIKKRALVSGRVDDQSEDKINNRIRVYKEETLPVLNHYKKLNKYIPVDGIGSIDEIFELIISKLEGK